MVLNLWDCGGQDLFYENYFESQRNHIFRNVEVLIYVFDVESNQKDKDMQYFTNCLDAILQYSENAMIFCLLHKMDLIDINDQQRVFNEHETRILSHSMGLKTKCFATSMYVFILIVSLIFFSFDFHHWQLHSLTLQSIM